MTAIPKPKLRGITHLWSFFIASIGSVILIFQAASGLATLSVTIYSLSLAAMFGVSALYHIPTWNQKSRQLLKRLDHATIFILIAGSYSPVCLLVLDPIVGIRFLKTVWAVALLGVMQSLFWIKAPKIISSGVYLILGWMVVPYMSQILKIVGWPTVFFILASGIIYTTGAIIYGMKKPNPWPKTFGYHEIFHALVILASLSYFVAVLKMIHLFNS